MLLDDSHYFSSQCDDCDLVIFPWRNQLTGRAFETKYSIFEFLKGILLIRIITEMGSSNERKARNIFYVWYWGDQIFNMFYMFDNCFLLITTWCAHVLTHNAPKNYFCCFVTLRTKFSSMILWHLLTEYRAKKELISLKARIKQMAGIYFSLSISIFFRNFPCDLTCELTTVPSPTFFIIHHFFTIQ